MKIRALFCGMAVFLENHRSDYIFPNANWVYGGADGTLETILGIWPKVKFD